MRSRASFTKTPSRPVVVLGTRFPALALVQSLAFRGVPCWVLAPRPLQAAWSRYSRFRSLPDFTKREKHAVAALGTLVRDKIGGRPIIIPTGDIEAAALARHAGELEPFAELCVSHRSTIDLILDKRAFYTWSDRHNFSCPATSPVTTEIMPFDPPFVIKPMNYSVMIENYLCDKRGPSPFGFKFWRIETTADWRDFRQRQRTNLELFMAQELVDGKDDDRYSIGIYADRNSEIKALFVGRVLRCYPPFYGNTVLGQNDCVPEVVLAEVNAIVKQLRLSGIAEFEYRREASSGRFRLLEINPRCWSWMQAGAATPADIAWTAYRDLCGEKISSPQIANAKPGQIKVVRGIFDVANILLRYPNGHRNRRMSLGAWRRSLSAERLTIVETRRFDWPLTLFCLVLLARDMVTNQG